MKKNVAKLLFGLSLLSVFGCKKEEPLRSEDSTNITYYEVVAQTIPVDFQFVGVTQSSHLVDITPRVEGYLEKIAYKEGQIVRKGDLLFQLDKSQYEVSLKEAEANLKREEASFFSTKQTVDRYQPLYEQKAASKKDLDDATGMMKQAEANVQSALAKRKKAELNLSYTSILSPISGLTTNSSYREGALITPGQKTIMTSVAVVDPMWVNLSVSDAYFLNAAKDIQEGRLIVPKNYNFDVKIRLADGTLFPGQGKVDFISPLLDPDTGSLSARVILPNPDYQLKPGQFVRATASGALRPNAMIIPQKSVQQGSHGLYVFVINNQNRAELRHVEMGDWYKEFWIVNKGLKVGDRVVVDGINKIKNNSLVNPSAQARK
ncbi:MAG: efflux RND transporter periplasmic adaptor subunit [Rhabdochlamydiaceae bacterium]